MDLIQFEQPIYADPSFPMIYHIDQLTDTRRSVYTNWHTGIELLYIINGEGILLADSERYPFRSGDIAVIRSDVLHSVSAKSEICTYHCLIVEPNYLSDHGFDMQHAAFLEIVRDIQMAALFDLVVEAFRAGGEWFKPTAIAAVLQLFLYLFQHHRYQSAAPGRHVGSGYPLIIMQALSYIQTNLCGTITIDAISKHVNVSKYYFCRMFRMHTGYPVLHYINVLRCSYARKLMIENGYNVSEAANQLGIYNLSYFTRLYKRHMGITPSMERKNIKTRPGGVADGLGRADSSPWM